MWNRVDKTLSAAEIQSVNDAVQIIHDKISTGYGLTFEERRKGGWYLSPKALLLLEHALVLAKANPSSFPKLDITAFERDILLIRQIQKIESQIMQLQFILEDNRRLLTKDSAEQGFYVYRILKVMHDLGISEGQGYEQLKPYLPRTGKKGKEKTE